MSNGMQVLSKDKKANIEVRVLDKCRSTVRTISLYAPDDTADTVRDRIKFILENPEKYPIKEEVVKSGIGPAKN